MPDETTGSAHLYKIWDPNEVIRELDVREKAMHRFAIGVDMPPAKVEGIEDANHWNAWALDKEAMEHLAPVCVDFANDLASAYLRPTLRKDQRRATGSGTSSGTTTPRPSATPTSSVTRSGCTRLERSARRTCGAPATRPTPTR